MCTSDLHINNATKVIVIDLLCKEIIKKRNFLLDTRQQTQDKTQDNRQKTQDIRAYIVA